MAKSKHKCCKCGASSCGDDTHTRSTYRQEDTVGDVMKVFLLHSFDLMEVHNLQVYEMKALYEALLKEHIIETDDFTCDY